MVHDTRVQDTLSPDGPVRHVRPRDRARLAALALAGATLLGLGVTGIGLSGKAPRAPVASIAPQAGPQAALAPMAESADPADIAPAPEPRVNELWQSAHLDPLAPASTDTPPAEPEAAPQPVPQGPAPLVQTVPLPMPRPLDLHRGPATSVPTRRVDRQVRRVRTGAVQPPIEDTRSFFDKLFGVERPASPPSPALAYAALGTTGSIETAPRVPRISPLPAPPTPNPGAGGGTAVYDISARIVTMPNGERLEAHSGIGPTMDDPRYVHVPMRGPTPPGTYDLTPRETPFHGVQAIRLNPVGGSASVHGRVGLLAHSYLRGPSGASSGCVSFRNYNRFLQAYLRGEVQRIVVVPGRGDVLPTIVERLFGKPTQTASAGNDR